MRLEHFKCSSELEGEKMSAFFIISRGAGLIIAVFSFFMFLVHKMSCNAH